MQKATEKSPAIEAFLQMLTGINRPAAVAASSCVTCGGEADTFRDEKSEREFRISGMCQFCQDSVFGE
tara:strand:+ start:218 stop:421 length:204 start_codon:yes stop_codon:yes gene_type:complete